MNEHVMPAGECQPALTTKDFKSGISPIWCPGCGDYGVVAAVERALVKNGRPAHEVVLVSGIGCSSRLPAYTTCYGFHGLHGRGLPAAIGLKLARPDLDVIAVGGDGDGYSIGGNHFMHACRRNVDMLYIVMDNRVYGMTKGQPSPTTEPDWDSDIAPGGVGVFPFNSLAVAIASGANFVARSFSGNPNALSDLIIAGLRHPGFSLIEVKSPCVTFRPEQIAWKKQVHPMSGETETDRTRAIANVMADDGFSLGILFKGDRPPAPYAKPATTDLAEIETEFAVGPTPPAVDLGQFGARQPRVS